MHDKIDNWVERLMEKLIRSNLAIKGDSIDKLVKYTEGISQCTDKRIFTMIYRTIYPMTALSPDDFESQSLESMTKIFKTMSKVIIKENLNSVVS